MNETLNTKALEDEELEKAAGGVTIQYENRCPKCHSVAYILILMEAGGVEHHRCTCCKTEYWYKR